MENNGSISIFRGSDGFYYVELRCEKSRTTFAKVKMDEKQFARTITGVTETPCEITYKGLDRVNKNKVIIHEKVKIPSNLWDRDKINEYIINRHQKDGWNLDTFLGSQNSIVKDGDDYYANISYYRFEVDE